MSTDKFMTCPGCKRRIEKNEFKCPYCGRINWGITTGAIVLLLIWFPCIAFFSSDSLLLRAVIWGVGGLVGLLGLVVLSNALFKPSLQKMQKKQDIPGLIKLLVHKDDGMRQAAVEALEKIDSNWMELTVAQKAIPTLVAVLKDKDSDVQEAAGKTLGMLGWQPENDTQRAYYAIATQRWADLEQLGPAAVEPLVAAFKNQDSGVRETYN